MKKYLVLIIATVMLLAAVGACAAPAYGEEPPPEPTYDTAVVDGNISEWDLTEDFFAEMYRAGDPEKSIESRLYLRYDCASDTLFGLIKAEPGIPIEVDGIEEHWVKVEDNLVLDDQTGNDNSPPDFAWVGLSEEGDIAEGWEFSISLPDGTYSLVVHTLANDDQEIQTSASEPLELVINCGPTAITNPSFTAQSGEKPEDSAPPWQIIAIVLGLGGILAFVAKKFPGISK